MIKNTVKFGVIISVVLLSVRVGLSEVTVAETGPVVDRPWPIGSRAVIDFPTRFMWWTDPPMGGGRYHFHYSCTTTDEFNEVLEAFGAIQADRLELIVHGAAGGESHWAFTVWDNEVWRSNMTRIEPTTPLFLPSSLRPPPAPRINLYAGGPCFLVWEDVIVPPNVTVIDRRTGPANLKQEIDRLKAEVARLRADIRQLQDLVLQLYQQMGLQ
jgi:hypothetical protein